MTDYHELAVFFDLEKMSGREYSVKSWETFMKNCSPLMLRNSQIFRGEAKGPMPDGRKMFCIAVRTTNVSAIEYLKTVFGACDDPILASPVDRIRETDVISKNHLKYRARIDAEGRLITRNWRRTDHDFCKRYNWAYAPLDFPPYLSPDLIEELERMSEPGHSISSQNAPEKSTRSPSSKLPFRFSLFLGKQALYAVFAIGIFVLIFWSVSKEGRENLRTLKKSVSERIEIGNEAHKKRREGYALAAMGKIPKGLDIGVLNAKLEEKFYHVLNVPNSPHADVWLDCSVWFSTNEVFRPDPQTITQAFLKLDMRALDDTLIWTCLAKGTRLAPGKEHENEALRLKALEDAVMQMDTSVLPDGTSVRNFQEQQNFDALKRLVEHRIKRTDELAAGNVSRDEWEAFRRQLLEELTNQWVVTRRIELASGASLEAIKLEERGGVYKLRIPSGFVSVPAGQVKTIAPLGKKTIADNIRNLLNVKQDACSWWQKQVIQEVVDAFSEQCAQYGAHFPGVCAVDIDFAASSGEFEAVVRTQRGKRRIKTGDRIEGYTVIGADSATRSVLVKKGKGGDILRIWPEFPEAESL